MVLDLFLGSCTTDRDMNHSLGFHSRSYERLLRDFWIPGDGLGGFASDTL